MRNTFLLILLSALQAFSLDGYAQNKKINLTMSDATIREVLQSIENQSEFYFMYNSELIDVTRKVDVTIADKRVDEILTALFNPNEVDYLIKDRYIILTPAGEDAETFYQQGAVSGKVTSADGQPLPGVTVVVKGTTRGTVTNADGEYSLTNLPADAVLQFSFVGMKVQEIKAGGRTAIDVVMEEETIGLEEVVAIGFGTQKKRDVSTSISSVSSETLENKAVSNFSRAIAGEMAGVRILNSNNAPGGGTNIIIRGISSINASNDPLIVIDGFPLKDGFDMYENPLNAINPDDIESIEVLKDASSSAIYGARAANGVILITTKKGRIGKPTINFNISSGYEQMINELDLLNREDFLQFMDDARAMAYTVEDPNLGTDNPNVQQWQWTDSNETRWYNWTNFSSVASAALGQPLYRRFIIVTDETKAQPYNTDWQDVVTKLGNVHDFQVSATGGTDNLKYMLSGGFYSQDGIMNATGYNRFSFRSNVELKINNWMKTGLLLAPSYENLDLMANLETSFYDIARTTPITAPYDENGEIAFLGVLDPDDWKNWNLYDIINPLNHEKRTDNRVTAKNLATLFGEITLAKGLTFRSEIHTEIRNWQRNYFSPNAYPKTRALTSRSYGINNISTRIYWNSQNFLTFNRQLGKHSVNAMIGYSAEETTYKSTYLEKYDYPTDAIPTLNQATTIISVQDDARTNQSSESMIGSFARAMYNYNSKYYLTGSVRRDGSSKFGADKKWGIFPSVSAAWRISGESFFNPFTGLINDLKLRGGYGVIGNSGIGNYRALSTLTASSYIFGKSSTITPAYVDGRISNSDLGWESTTDYSVGADMELLNSRISFTMDYFYRLTEDMLFSMPLPSITGFNSYMVNIGSMRNRGFEYLLKTRNLTGKFKWNTSVNLSYYRNRVLDTGKDKRPLITNDSYTSEDKPLAGIYTYKYLGPYKDWEDVKTSPIHNPNNPNWAYRSNPGTTKLADIDGNGYIDSSDRTIVGSPNPDFIWGMTNAFEFKNFDLSVQLTGVQGGDHLLTRMEYVMARPVGRGNVTYDYYNNYWRPDRTDAKYVAPNRKSKDSAPWRGTLLFEGSYVSVQNIAFGYTLPSSVVGRLNMSSLRIYSNIQNAAIFTNYPGYNPEVNSSGSSALSQGIDAGSYPMTRIISFGVNLSF